MTKSQMVSKLLKIADEIENNDNKKETAEELREIAYALADEVK